jgi:hypothetical protein
MRQSQEFELGSIKALRLALIVDKRVPQWLIGCVRWKSGARLLVELRLCNHGRLADLQWRQSARFSEKQTDATVAVGVSKSMVACRRAPCRTNPDSDQLPEALHNSKRRSPRRQRNSCVLPFAALWSLTALRTGARDRMAECLRACCAGAAGAPQPSTRSACTHSVTVPRSHAE